MKSIDQIAKLVLERRTKMNPIVFQGEMIELLGRDELVEALNRRWIVPSQDSGYLQITGDATIIEAMKMEADKAKDEEDASEEKSEEKMDDDKEARECACDEALRSAVLSHGNRDRRIHEMYGSIPPGPASGVTPATTPTKPATQPDEEVPRHIGDDVTVVENGQAYQGKVMAAADGRYKVSFGPGSRPPGHQEDKEYSEDELGAKE